MDQACCVMEPLCERIVVREKRRVTEGPDLMVFITVTNGVAYVDYVPPGVTVSVTDYDVDTRFKLASSYDVSQDTVQR